jgi:hypothetical protein
MSVRDAGTSKKLVGSLKFHGIGMKVWQTKNGHQSWCFDFTGSKITVVNWFIIQQNSTAEIVAFFNVGLRCWNIQKTSWFLEISCKWNASLANKKWPVLVLWGLHQFKSHTGELIRPLQQNSMVETVVFFNVGLRCRIIQKASWFCWICCLKHVSAFSNQPNPQWDGLSVSEPLPLGFGKLGRVHTETGPLVHNTKCCFDCMGSILARLIDIELHRQLQHLTMVGAGRMLAAIPPTLTFAEMADGWHLQVMRAKFAAPATTRKGIDASLVMKFETFLVVKSHFVFSSWNWHGRMAAIPLTLASPGKKEQPDLCIWPTQLATTSGSSAFPSVSKAIWFLSCETGMEK